MGVLVFIYLCVWKGTGKLKISELHVIDNIVNMHRWGAPTCLNGNTACCCRTDGCDENNAKWCCARLPEAGSYFRFDFE